MTGTYGLKKDLCGFRVLSGNCGLIPFLRFYLQGGKGTVFDLGFCLRKSKTCGGHKHRIKC